MDGDRGHSTVSDTRSAPVLESLPPPMPNRTRSRQEARWSGARAMECASSGPCPRHYGRRPEPRIPARSTRLRLRLWLAQAVGGGPIVGDGNLRAVALEDAAYLLRREAAAEALADRCHRERARRALQDGEHLVVRGATI